MSARYLEWPHGPCECNHHGCMSCARLQGPAVFLVERDGVELRVCTKCDLMRDVDRGLLVTGDEDWNVLLTYDGFGALSVKWKLEAQREAAHNVPAEELS